MKAISAGKINDHSASDHIPVWAEVVFGKSPQKEIAVRQKKNRYS